MRVLIACEFSGTVRDSFRALGFEAWSCDIDPSPDNSPFHIQNDVLEVIKNQRFDMMIAHPPCTHLAVSGARHFAEKRSDGRQQEAIDFFMALVQAPIKYKAIENPVCIMSSVYRKPDQIIQPWQFGHGETKATCLWLYNLPKLTQTAVVSGREARIHKMPPSPNRAKLRSITYKGIAQAMADQWGRVLRDAEKRNAEQEQEMRDIVRESFTKAGIAPRY